MQPRTLTRDRALPKRTVVAAVMILLCIPAVIAAGILFLNDRAYYFIGLAVVILSMIPFMMVFENRKPQAREMVILTVLVALNVVGRVAFFWLPQFKPVVATVIIAGVCFGGEAGFIVGALTAFVSNFFFGHGPWTPWQMFALGIIGFLAGILFKKGMLRKTTVPLCVFGAVTSFAVYGVLLDTASLLMWSASVSWPALLVSFAAGLPFNAILAATTVVTLRLLAKPMIEKLDRVKKKYGLMEP